MARAAAVKVIWNCLIHGIVTVWHANAITEYLTKAPMVVYCQKGATERYVDVSVAA